MQRKVFSEVENYVLNKERSFLKSFFSLLKITPAAINKLTDLTRYTVLGENLEQGKAILANYAELIRKITENNHSNHTNWLLGIIREARETCCYWFIKYHKATLVNITSIPERDALAELIPYYNVGSSLKKIFGYDSDELRALENIYVTDEQRRLYEYTMKGGSSDGLYGLW